MEDRQIGLASDYEPTLREILAAAKRPGVLFNVPIHLFILIPATCVIAWLATRLDRFFGLSPFLSAPWNWVLFGIFFPLGIFVVWYVYGYLAIKGEGSPATHLGGTTKLVITGPFARCRHPSIIGKFLGVVGLGFLVASPIFMFVIIPLLTTYSLISARYWQERLCVRLWGDYYLSYRRQVPSVFPLLSLHPRPPRLDKTECQTETEP